MLELAIVIIILLCIVLYYATKEIRRLTDKWPLYCDTLYNKLYDKKEELIEAEEGIKYLLLLASIPRMNETCIHAKAINKVFDNPEGES